MTGFKGAQGDIGWVDATGDGRADTCVVDSVLTCTSVTGSGFGPTWSGPGLDEGYSIGRAWVDFNGDHRADFCRVVGGSSKQLQCTLSTGSSFGTTYTSAAVDAGYDAGRAWVDVTGDGRADYCRVVGLWGYQVSCTVSLGNSWGTTITSSTLDPGYDQGRSWVDVNGDNRADYCRITGSGTKYLQCTLMGGGLAFGSTISSNGLDPGYDDSRRWGDVNGDTRADYCRIVGSSNYAATTVQCTLSTGSGFGATFTSPTIDAGYGGTGTWADINADGKDDYCRETGSYAGTCTLSTGSSFGATISTPGSGTAGWGWADVNGDGRADYCRRESTNSASCTMSTGAGFGGTIHGNW
jgi:hypothetical protein